MPTSFRLDKKTLLILIIIGSVILIANYLIEHPPIIAENYIGVKYAAFYQYYNVSIVIDENGSLIITETFTVNLSSTIVGYAIRVIPYWSIGDIGFVGIYELWNGSWIRYGKRINEPGDYDIRISFDRYTIEWWFYYPTLWERPTTRTFMLKYIVYNEVGTDDARNINYLIWKCIPKRNAPIGSAKVDIWIPSVIEESDLEVQPEPSRIVYTNDSTVLFFTASNLANDETLEVYVAFPKFLNVPTPIRKFLNINIIPITAIYVVLTLIIQGVVYLAIVPKRFIRIPSTFAKMPPSKTDPIEISFLRNPLDNVSKFLTILVSLASKGFLSFTQKDEEVYINLAREFSGAGLPVWESTILQSVKEGSMSLKELFKIVQKDVFPETDKALSKSLGEKKLIVPNYKKKLSKVSRDMKILIILALISGILHLAIGVLINSLTPVVAGLIILFPGTFGLAYIGRKVSTRTKEGEIEYKHAQAFSKRLKDLIENALKASSLDTAIIRIREILNNQFTWIVAVDGIAAFKLLKKIDSSLKKKWGTLPGTMSFYPDWLKIQDVDKFNAYLDKLSSLSSLP